LIFAGTHSQSSIQLMRPISRVPGCGCFIDVSASAAAKNTRYKDGHR
jgi:hypothetical protein